MGSVSEAKKPHAICIPYPAQGHINPILKLAKLLHQKGFHITYVNTEYNHSRLLRSRGPDSLQGLPDFQFQTIPDGLPPSDANITQNIPALCESITKNCLLPFRNLINNLNSASNTPPVSCIISDAAMNFTLDAAEEFGVPNVSFWTMSACGFLGYLQYPHLIETGVIPLKDESYLKNGYLETSVSFAPGIDDIRLRDLPTFLRTTDHNDIMVDFILRKVEGSSRATAIILNTFNELETEVLSAIKVKFDMVYTVGPLQLLVDQGSEDGLESVGSNLWKEEQGCIEWLDSKEPGSVVYVNFGSITVVTPEQMMEFAWGLANSKQAFLWVIRPDLVSGDSAMLSSDFLAVIKRRGLLVSWCPQEQVLNHPSIGGFLTHNGWNSTLESICNGIPMICWPFFGEQQMNCRFACRHWGIGMEIDNNVKRDEVESLVRELMEGEKGKEMRANVMEWKKKAEKASAPGGSSYENLNKLVSEILKTTKTK
ncbi:7-deoxyloganetin glucosyltransferase [Ranunculus cassubicifolius]